MANTKRIVYRYTAERDWETVPQIDAVAIAANGKRVVLAKRGARQIYEFIGNTWKKLPGINAKDVAVDADSAVWMVGRNGSIQKLESNAGQ
ncbi:MAG: tectonin domain-containing protein [Pyrinomonadaceae bacterium]